MASYKIRHSLFNMKSIKVKCVFITTIIVLLLVYILMDLWLFYKLKKPNISVQLQNVVVHLDLKGSPPKLTYLMSLLPMLKNLGVTGLLMEYEDMFPYEGRLVNLSASNRYQKDELKEFLTVADKSGLEIIPLVQTFGHMEHVLKLSEFQHLREMPFYPDSICPSRKESKDLIRDMLDQVIKFHNDVKPLKYFHIGCDEVYHINKCDRCRSGLLQDINLFVNHVEAVKRIVKEITPKTIALIWDDMFRSINVSDWDRIDKFSDVEPVYWNYRKNVELSHISLLKYHSRFKNIWIASAFKGADGRTATLPNLTNRFLNHFSWMNAIEGYKFGGENKVFNFKGVILTGWSRYSHMDPPCELLPSSMPSLVLNLLLIKRFKDGIPANYRFLHVDEFFWTFLIEEFNNRLQCANSLSIEYFDNSQCSFEGNELYTAQRLNYLLNLNITDYLNDVNRGISAVEYYANTNNINRIMAERGLKWCNETLIDLLNLEKQMTLEMSKFFDKSFINEYIGFKDNNAKKMLYKLSQSLVKSLTLYTWPRRPYYYT